MGPGSGGGGVFVVLGPGGRDGPGLGGGRICRPLGFAAHSQHGFGLVGGGQRAWGVGQWVEHPVAGPRAGRCGFSHGGVALSGFAPPIGARPRGFGALDGFLGRLHALGGGAGFAVGPVGVWRAGLAWVVGRVGRPDRGVGLGVAPVGATTPGPPDGWSGVVGWRPWQRRRDVGGAGALVFSLGLLGLFRAVVGGGGLFAHGLQRFG